MVSTTDFVSLGSSPSSPTKLTNMEEIEKINNKRLRQKEARADWKWVANNLVGVVLRTVNLREDMRLERKWFKNIHHKILFH